MAPPTDSASKPVLGLSSEPKSRGANRSTKVAGKLKVLPDQPTGTLQSTSPQVPAASAPAGNSGIVRSPVPPTPLQPPPPPRGRDFVSPGNGTTEDSDDDEVDDDGMEEAPEEEVRSNVLC
jgi:hypothetical protein